MTWNEIVTGVIIPILVSFLILYAGRQIQKEDRRKREDREHDLKYWRKLERILLNMQRQNVWVSRKMIEWVTIHNQNHPNSRIRLDDYPDDHIGDDSD